MNGTIKTTTPRYFNCKEILSSSGYTNVILFPKFTLAFTNSIKNELGPICPEKGLIINIFFITNF